MSLTSENIVVILTALNLEYEAVRKHLTDIEIHVHEAGTRFEVGMTPDRSSRVAIGLAGKGNHPAAVLAERAISQFQPLALFFVGVAGALRDHIRLGDVVVATHIYAYHGGTSEDEQFSARPRVWEAPHGLEQLAADLARSRSWIRLVGRSDSGSAPSVHRAPIASGDVLMQSRTSEEARRLRLHYNDAAATEMESAGIAQAGHLNAFDTMVIRGISDMANADKARTDRAGWQPAAARHAAAFAIALAEQVASESAYRGPGRRARRAEEKAEAPATFSNVAQGGAHVGFQAGQIFGGAHVHRDDRTAADDLETQIKELREALEQAYRERQLDADTYSAARSELAEAEASLPATEEKSRRRLVLALKRLKGLVEGVVDFASKVARILAGAETLR